MTATRIAVAGAVLLLAGCAMQPVRQPLSPERVPAAQARQLERERYLRQQHAWTLEGRIAVSNQGEGGSGSIDWRQTANGYAVTLSAPITWKSWRLLGNHDRARLEGLRGGPRIGPDPAQLLLAATGWRIPVLALADWVRGVRSQRLGAADVVYGADGRLLRLRQGGWTIEYRWPAAGAVVAGEVQLPVRLEARRGDAQVKLVVDEWGGL